MDRWFSVLLIAVTLSVLCWQQSVAEDAGAVKTLDEPLPYFTPGAKKGTPAEGTFPKGTRVRLIRRYQDYVLVQTLESGSYGWVSLSAFTKTSTDRASMPSSDGSALDKILVPASPDAAMRLSLELLKNLKRPRENALIAPHGVWLSLHILDRGAAGETAKQLNSAVQGDSAQAVHQVSGPSREYKMAISLWKRQEIELTSTFMSDIEQLGVQVVDTRFDSSTQDQINQFVREQSSGLIPDFLTQPLPVHIDLFLANVASFKSKWKVPFSYDESNPVPFHLSADQSRPIPMIYCKGRFDYLHDRQLQAQIVRIPYSHDDYIGLLVVPDQIDGLDELVKQLDSAKFDQFLKEGEEETTEIRLPPLQITDEFDLTPVIGKLIGEAAFGRDADFSRMTSSKGVKVGTVIQKTKLEVDQEGTRAAGATGTQLVPVGVSKDLKRVTADRPFLFFVVHKPSSTILFECAVAVPTALSKAE